MKKLLKIGLIVASVITVIIGIVAVFVSPVAKNYIEKHDHELLGRSIRMEQLKLNIFTGRMRVNDLRIGGVDDSTTFFRLDSFDMRLRLWPLLSHRVEVPYVTVVTPDVKVYQRGSQFNFDGILDLFMSDSTQVDEAPSKPWAVGIYDITIRGGHLFYKDLELNATWGLNDIDLKIPGVYFSGEKTDVGAVLNFAEGGSLETQVAYDMEASTFDIGLHLKDLTLTNTLPYFQQFLNVTAVDGKLTADVNLRGNMDHLLSVRTDGTASVAGFRMIDIHGREAATVDTLRIALREGDLGKMRFDFDKFYVGGFSTYFELRSDGNNFTDLMLPSSPEPAPVPAASGEEQAATPTPTLHIAELDIRDGQLLFRDLTLQRPFEYRITNLGLKGRDFTPDGRNKLTLGANMQKTGSARLIWEGSVSDINNQNITFVLTNVGLRDLSPYCEQYTAYPVTSGNLTFRSQNVIRNRNLDGTNHLDVFEPKVDNKRKDLTPDFKIPLKLGLYVLKDKKGHVKMDLPVQGSLDSPEFSYRKIVLKTIGNVLLKVVTAPFSFLTGHNNNLQYIDIDPQQYVFTSEQYASFDKIAQLIQEKPELKIALTQRVNAEKALPTQAANVLRMAYSRSLQPADSTTQEPRMSMLEYDKIQQIDIRTPEVMAFADSMLRLRGIDPQSISQNGKALALYREEAKAQLARMMESRDKAVATYMGTTHKIPAPAFRMQPTDSAAHVTYTGRDRYTLTLEVDGETVEVAADNSGETAPESTRSTANENKETAPERADSAAAAEGAKPIATTTKHANPAVKATNAGMEAISGKAEATPTSSAGTAANSTTAASTTTTKGKE